MSFFQSQIYYELMDGVPGVEPFIHKEIGADGSIAGQYMGAFIQSGNKYTRRYTSRILFIDEPTVFSHDSEKIFNMLYSKISDITKQYKPCIYTEIRFIQHNPVHFDFSRISHCEYNPYLNIVVNTSINEDQLFQNLSESKRRQVKMSYKAGAFVKRASNENEVKSFYNILLNLYRTKVRKPLYPLDFFMRFFNKEEAGILLLAYYNNKVIGGMLCPISGKKEMYEWYIAGLDLELQKKMIYPSVLLTWEALKFASLNNIQNFNFMGAGKPDSSYGVRDFKLTFGGELFETPRYIFPQKPLLYTAGKFVMKLGIGTYLTSDQ
jgi:serine/alanine adding enzyme